MPVIMGVTCMECDAEGKKLENLRKLSLIRGSSMMKLRHSSF